MTLLVPNVGEIEMLKRALNFSATGDVKLRLYKTDVTPVEVDTVSTYTEAAATGYAAITLTGASWSVANVGGVTTAQYALQTFAVTTQETYYGYYLTDSAGTTLIWAEKFSDGPYAMGTAGGSVKVTPKITLE